MRIGIGRWGPSITPSRTCMHVQSPASGTHCMAFTVIDPSMRARSLRGCLISPSVLSNTGRSGVNRMGRPASLKVDSSASLRMTE